MSTATATAEATPSSTPGPIAGSSIARKFAEVMHLVDKRIPKSGRNTFHGYNYATESDILESVRGNLAERRIAVLPSLDPAQPMTREQIGSTRNGDPKMLVTVPMIFTILDGDTDEREIVHWVGTGEDPSDKGVYKAMTGALKYWTLKTFMIPTGDDPEADKTRTTHVSDDRAGQGGAAKPATSNRFAQAAPKPAAAPAPAKAAPAPAAEPVHPAVVEAVAQIEQTFGKVQAATVVPTKGQIDTTAPTSAEAFHEVALAEVKVHSEGTRPKSGKPYKLYKVITSAGQTFAALDEIGDGLAKAQASGEIVLIKFRATQYGPQIAEFQTA